MHRGLARLLLLALPGLLVIAGLTPAADAAATVNTKKTTFVTLVSDGDTIGTGRSWTWYPGAGSVYLSQLSNGEVALYVSGGPSGGDFSFTFGAARGETLQTGLYRGATRAGVAGHPHIDINGNGDGCNETRGRFRVLEWQPELDRLHLVYEQHCDNGSGVVFGEISYNMPSDNDPDLLLAAAHVSWPAQYTETQAHPVPVTLVNTGSRAIEITDASLGGSADFSLLENTCSTIDVGKSCVVYLGFRPATGGPRSATLSIRGATGSPEHRVVLAGRGIKTHSSWDMHSEQGEYVGGGQDWAFSPADIGMTAEGSESALRVIAPAEQRWTADFRADSGHLLLPGTTFTDTVPGAGGRSTPSIDVSRSGYSCSPTGSFTVHEAKYVGGILRKISLTFEQHCGDDEHALFGSIAWKADTPARPVPGTEPTPPEAVTDLQAMGLNGAVTLSWTNPAEDWADTVVRRSQGDDAPATAYDGYNAFTGRADAVTLKGLVPGTSYTFSVFSRDSDRTPGPGRTVTVRGTDLSLAATKTPINRGNGTRLRGVLADSDGGGTLGGEPLAVLARRKGTTTWNQVATTTTRPDGSYAVARQPRTTSFFKVLFAGSGNHLGRTATPVKVRVR